MAISLSTDILSREISSSSSTKNGLGLRGNLSIKLESNPADDGVRLSESLFERIESRGQEEGLRRLSDVSSIVNVGAGATEEITRLVDRALEISETLNSAVSPETTSALTQEAGEILSRLDSIAEDAQFNNTSVVNAGRQTFQFDLKPSNSSSNSVYSVTVPNIPISPTALGLDNLTAADFSANPSETNELLTAASGSLSNTSAELEESNRQLQAVAAQVGVSREKEASLKLNASAATGFATELSDAIRESGVLQQNNVEQLRVADLIQSAPEKTDSPTSTIES